MSELEAPPPPGSDTPVPADVVATPRRRRRAASAPDGLVPKTAIEQRAERRARERRARTLPPPLANPMAGAVTPAVAAQLAWDAQRRASGVVPGMVPPGWPGHPGAPALQQPPMPYGQALPYGQAVPYGQPAPYQVHAQPAYAPLPSGQPIAYGPAPMPMPPVLQAPPKRPLTRRQTRAALLGSLVGQLLLAAATHLLVTSAFVLLLWGSLSEGGTSGLDALEADSLTDVVAFWADPARIPITIVILLLIAGIVAAIGCTIAYLWHRSVGLVGIKRSIALAYVTTTAIGGFVGGALWPFVLLGGLFFSLAGGGTFSIGAAWGYLFTCLAISIVLTAAVGMLFGWVYLLAFRPRPTWEQLEAERRQAELDAERRALEADAAELARVD